MHRATPILQHLWQDVADPRGFVVLEACQTSARVQLTSCLA